MGRRLSREIAMKLLYQMELQKDYSNEQTTRFLAEHTRLNKKDKEYIADIANGVSENMEFIDPIITKYLRNWSINRIPKIDLCILRLSTYEIAFRKDIPFNVSINEAIEISKKYSTEESAPFINGILGQIVEYLENTSQNERHVKD